MVTFKDYQQFKPTHTPVEMFAAGIFCGAYFQRETILPPAFIEEAGASIQALENPTARVNLYGVASGSTLEWWETHGLIHVDDPNGWVEWYVKFFYGRRHADDDRQIKRWQSFITRHSGMLRSYIARGADSPKTRQNLLQWAYEIQN